MVNQFVAALELLDEEARRKLAHRIWPNADVDSKVAMFSEWRYADEPKIVAPQTSLSLTQIIRYKPEEHKKLFDRGFGDAARSLRELGA
jgi:hypothetical protein